MNKKLSYHRETARQLCTYVILGSLTDHRILLHNYNHHQQQRQSVVGPEGLLT